MITRDDERYTTLLPSCFYCKHLTDAGTQVSLQGWKCPAFPNGISVNILDRTLSHEEILPGQQGELVYESREIDGHKIAFDGTWDDEEREPEPEEEEEEDADDTTLL